MHIVKNISQVAQMFLRMKQGGGVGGWGRVVGGGGESVLFAAIRQAEWAQLVAPCYGARTGQRCPCLVMSLWKFPFSPKLYLELWTYQAQTFWSTSVCISLQRACSNLVVWSLLAFLSITASLSTYSSVAPPDLNSVGKRVRPRRTKVVDEDTGWWIRTGAKVENMRADW